MFNLFKKSDLTLEFFTNTNYAMAYEFFPVQSASKFIPNWYKNAPKSEKTNNTATIELPEYTVKKTVKGCIGIQNTITAGAVIPWWSDLQFSVKGNDYRYSFADLRSEISHHSNEQAPGFLEDYLFLKVECPWLLRSSKRIKFMMMPYFYSDNQQDVIFMPAIGETFTRYNMSNLNFFIAVKRTNDLRTFNFTNNTPAMQIIPLTEDDYTIKTDIMKFEEFQRIQNLTSTMATPINSGFYLRKLSKCPFHNKD